MTSIHHNPALSPAPGPATNTGITRRRRTIAPHRRDAARRTPGTNTRIKSADFSLKPPGTTTRKPLTARRRRPTIRWQPDTTPHPVCLVRVTHHHHRLDQATRVSPRRVAESRRHRGDSTEPRSISIHFCVPHPVDAGLSHESRAALFRIRPVARPTPSPNLRRLRKQRQRQDPDQPVTERIGVRPHPPVRPGIPTPRSRSPGISSMPRSREAARIR